MLCWMLCWPSAWCLIVIINPPWSGQPNYVAIVAISCVMIVVVGRFVGRACLTGGSFEPTPFAGLLLFHMPFVQPSQYIIQTCTDGSCFTDSVGNCFRNALVPA